MRQAHQSHSMLDQSGGLHKVKSGMQHTLSPPPAGAASSSSLAGVDVRAMNLQVAGMPQAVPSPPTAALLFSGAQQVRLFPLPGIVRRLDPGVLLTLLAIQFIVLATASLCVCEFLRMQKPDEPGGPCNATADCSC